MEEDVIYKNYVPKVTRLKLSDESLNRLLAKYPIKPSKKVFSELRNVILHAYVGKNISSKKGSLEKIHDLEKVAGSANNLLIGLKQLSPFLIERIKKVSRELEPGPNENQSMVYSRYSHALEAVENLTTWIEGAKQSLGRPRPGRIKRVDLEQSVSALKQFWKRHTGQAARMRSKNRGSCAALAKDLFELASMNYRSKYEKRS